MQKYIFLILAMLPTGFLRANDYLLEGKISYFYPTDHITREIMGSGALYGIEASFQAYDWIYPWISLSLLPNSGHSIGKHHDTNMYFVPIGIGLKGIFETGTLCRYYFGAGMLPAYLHTSDYSSAVVRSRHKWGFGGIFKAGILLDIRCFFIDIFADYTLLSISFSNTDKTLGRTADLDGFSAGAGFGYRF